MISIEEEAYSEMCDSLSFQMVDPTGKMEQQGLKFWWGLGWLSGGVIGY